MRIYSIKDYVDNIQFYGRTWKNRGIYYFDWSVSGFELYYRGKILYANFIAYCGFEPSGGFGDALEPKREIWPRIAIFIDGEEEPSKIIDITSKTWKGEIYSSPTQEIHYIRVVKLTENVKSGLGIDFLEGDGEILDFQKEKKEIIEFIGDSITCGYGNMTHDIKKRFFSEDENGWMAYGTITSRMLGLEPHIIASSGFCLAMKEWNGKPYAINELYEYTNRVRQDREGCIELEKWNFTNYPAKYVVINLGTNDAEGVNYYEDNGEKERQFEEDYRKFLYTVRKCNGINTKIICTLGDMRYYLFENIKRVVENYKIETRDKNIYIFKLPGIKVGEPRGASSHPSVESDIRLAKALVSFIQQIVES